MMIGIGELVGGRYRVEGVVGAGGMGIVLAAHDMGIDRSVCLKVARRATDHDTVVREARLASRLRGEHVCRIFDVCMLDDGRPCIVMERIDGEDLEAAVAARGPLPIGEAVALIGQACEAIAEAHALGIVHRDLKPTNMLLGRRLDGTPLLKIVDFGFARTMAATHATGGGSPAYVAPEQARREAVVDARSDVYGLGAVLHFLVTGRPPIDGLDGIAAVVQAMSEAPRAASRLRPDVPPELDRIILRCLATRPDDRYRDAADLAAALSTSLASPGAPVVTRRSTLLAVIAAASLAVPMLDLVSSDVPALAPPPSVFAGGTSEEPSTRATSTATVRAGVPDAARSMRSSMRSPAPEHRVRVRDAARPASELPATDRVHEDATASAAAATGLPRICRTDDYLCQFGAKR